LVFKNHGPKWPLAERDQISAQLDRSAVTIRFDDEDSGAECRWGAPEYADITEERVCDEIMS
jgi:hypothetical protein